MTRRPFEIIAECELPRFPAQKEITRIGDQLEQARRARPEIVRVTVTPPAVFRKNRYILEARAVVWAEDVPGAVRSVEGLVAAAGVPCLTVLPSGRALSTAEVPPPPETVAAGGNTGRRRGSPTGRTSGERKKRPRRPRAA
ncbi:MAG: hypothetical protein QN141_10510 [Armatimonadota bacterium]|nr:hypothetical protein [Armatimonadota bacterium]MDR7451521.1 hypothetical protein [Armatimonadota bacterium]MDR7467488.1 hypothetical protein [Armatimonadota bacterium]MDR7494362.1 hypothetical protein [Armatimonadota bacterium]MDR7499179.1 hypothetical protein [Armatimonadota bacterium]